MRKILTNFRNYFSTKMPFISLAGIALCWLVYFFAPRAGESIDDLPMSHWKLMGVIVWATIIFGALFVLSLIVYLIYRPLPNKNKWLHFVLRILIALITIFVTCFGGVMSIFIFAGAGF